MSPFLYAPIYFWSITAIFLIVAVRYMSSRGYNLQEKGNRDLVFPVLITMVLIFWLGNRPIYGGAFGDTANYASEYVLMTDPTFLGIDWHGEWMWQWLMVTCKASGMSVHAFLTIVEMIYMTTALVAAAIIIPRNPMLTMLFFWDSLMFFTFGTNGLRNGLACNITLLGFAFLFTDHRATAIIIGLLAFAFHRSTILPIASVICAMTFFKNPKHGIYVWLASIVVSMFAGGAATAFFANLGFDDRMSAYAGTQYNEFHEGGRFRWDFLLYSAMPILMGWYVCIKRQMSESWYNVLFNTYCLCNAFWVLVIRATFSNRFAYLSWFMYPLIIAYPLIMMPLWNDQDSKIGVISLAYMFFTIAMQIMWGYI